MSQNGESRAGSDIQDLRTAPSYRPECGFCAARSALCGDFRSAVNPKSRWLGVGGCVRISQAPDIGDMSGDGGAELSRFDRRDCRSRRGRRRRRPTNRPPLVNIHSRGPAAASAPCGDCASRPEAGVSTFALSGPLALQGIRRPARSSCMYFGPHAGTLVTRPDQATRTIYILSRCRPGRAPGQKREGRVPTNPRSVRCGRSMGRRALRPATLGTILDSRLPVCSLSGVFGPATTPRSVTCFVK
jgi:hypothetical protein